MPPRTELLPIAGELRGYARFTLLGQRCISKPGESIVQGGLKLQIGSRSFTAAKIDHFVVVEPTRTIQVSFDCPRRPRLSARRSRQGGFVLVYGAAAIQFGAASG